ncbi:MAG TPA: hypothetical protein VJP02_25185 [Candidatus Sulfotelmatobacter sp.]|nr:hypothetical protein [Candidatus Sulfotelmatobacter sp.]
MKLEEHKKNFLHIPIGRKTVWDISKPSDLKNMLHAAEEERTTRRLGLHRVEEALADADLSRDEIAQYVQFLIAESKRRQQEIEQVIPTENKLQLGMLLALEDSRETDLFQQLRAFVKIWTQIKVKE